MPRPAGGPCGSGTTRIICVCVCVCVVGWVYACVRVCFVPQVQVGKSALMSMLPQPKNLFQKAKISTGEASSVGTITSQEGDAMRAKNKNMPTKKSTASLTPYVLGKKKEAVPIDTSRKSAIAKKPAATAKGEEDEDGEEESTPFFSFHSAKDDEALLAQDKATSEAGSIPTAYATTVEQRTAHQVCHNVKDYINVMRSFAL